MDAAIAILSKAKAAAPHDVELKFTLADIYRRGRRYDLLLSTLAEAIRANPQEYQRAFALLDSLADDSKAALGRYHFAGGLRDLHGGGFS